MNGAHDSMLEAARARADGGPQAIDRLVRAFTPPRRSFWQRIGEHVGPYVTGLVITVLFVWVAAIVAAVTVFTCRELTWALS